MEKRFLILTLFSFFVESVFGSCKLHDASWESNKGLMVTQPSKSDPTKVKIDWSNVIKNARYANPDL